MFGFLDKLALDSGLMLLLCSVTLALVCLELCVAVSRGRLSSRPVITLACRALLVVSCALLAGFVVSLLPLDGAWAQIVYYVLMAAVLAAVIVIYVAGERKQVRAATANALRLSAGNTAAVRYAKGWIYGTCLTLLIAAAVAFFCGVAEYYRLVFPVAVVAVAILLARIVPLRFWYAVAAAGVLLFVSVVLFGSISAADSPAVVAASLVAAALLAAGCITLIFRRE